MNIISRQFGPIDIEENTIFNMPFGMPGFEGLKRYAVIEREEIWPFSCFQSLDEPELNFYIMDPALFEPDYEIDLSHAAKEIGWGNGIGDIKIYAIINTSDGVPEKITANLLGPLLIHTKRFEAFQFVRHDGKYSHKTPVFKALNKEKAEEAPSYV